MVKYFFKAPLLLYVMQQWWCKRQSRNAGSFPRKELGGALRIGPKTQRTDLTPLSSVA